MNYIIYLKWLPLIFTVEQCPDINYTLNTDIWWHFWELKIYLQITLKAPYRMHSLSKTQTILYGVVQCRKNQMVASSRSSCSDRSWGLNIYPCCAQNKSLEFHIPDALQAACCTSPSVSRVVRFHWFIAWRKLDHHCCCLLQPDSLSCYLGKTQGQI